MLCHWSYFVLSGSSTAHPSNRRLFKHLLLFCPLLPSICLPAFLPASACLCMALPAWLCLHGFWFQVADSRGYYPGEKGYNPDLAPPPVQSPPQGQGQGMPGQGQYAQGANSNGSNQSQDVFIPDGYGGFVRRPNSPPPMEKKVLLAAVMCTWHLIRVVFVSWIVLCWLCRLVFSSSVWCPGTIVYIVYVLQVSLCRRKVLWPLCWCRKIRADHCNPKSVCSW